MDNAQVLQKKNRIQNKRANKTYLINLENGGFIELN